MRRIIFGVIFIFSLQLVHAGELAGYGPSVEARQKQNSNTGKYTKYDPFFEACKKTDSNQKTIPIEAISPNQMGVPQIVQNDQMKPQSHSAFDLINKSYKTTQATLQQNLENTKKSLACLDEVFEKEFAKLKMECQATFKDISNTAVANQRARLELAMALPDSKVLNETQYQTLNTDLKTPITTFKATPWVALTKNEESTVRQSWDAFLSDAEKQAKEKVPASFNFAGSPVSLDFKKNLIEKKRNSAKLNYHLQMTKFPLIQFISSSDPQKADFKKAYELVIENIKKEMDQIKTKQNKLVLNPKKLVNTDDLSILNYQTTENVLKSNPEYCSIAQSLMEFQKQKQMYIDGGTMAVLLGATLSGNVPAAAIFMAGLAHAGYNTYDDYIKYKEAMQAYLASSTSDDQIFIKSKVDANKESLVVNTALLATMGLPPPIKMTQVLVDAKLVASQQARKVLISDSVKIEQEAVKKAKILKRIDEAEAKTMAQFDRAASDQLTKSGRGVGKIVKYVDENGKAIQARIAEHVIGDADGQISVVVFRHEKIDGKIKLIKEVVPAEKIVPVQP
jgi:hypothetical protein